MRRIIIFLIRRSHRIRFIVFKMANLQASLGFALPGENESAEEDMFSIGSSTERILEISRYIQPRQVAWFDLVRIGGPGDGGYVMLDNLEAIEGALSLGVGSDVSWDLEISKKVPLIHLYDHTIEQLPSPIPRGIWFKEKVVPANDVTGTSFDNAVGRLPDSNRLILKCDIEDSEWEILAECDSRTLDKFDQIVIEFHWITDKLLGFKYQLMLEVLEKLAQTHSVVNIHANNYGNVKIIGNCPVPEVIEISYVRTRSYQFELLSSTRKLNAPNNSQNPEIFLNFPIPL